MNKLAHTLALVLLLVCLSVVPAFSQQAPCSDPGYRQFDFWVGKWDVFGPKGKLVATNSIEKEYGGCVLHERYATLKVYTGESLNTYDPARKMWHQTWVDNSGMLLLLDGEFDGKSMVLEGKTLDTAGKETRHRITWTPNTDASVRQRWESTDAKGAWTVAFDGLYKRKTETK